jgi:hypothetical protein
LVGRGRFSLDCFRIYEAILCGAIPVVIGSQHEIDQTFEFEGDPPPLFTAPDAATALGRCRRTSNDVIDAMRISLASWYVRRMRHIISRVRHTVKVFRHS